MKKDLDEYASYRVLKNAIENIEYIKKTIKDNLSEIEKSRTKSIEIPIWSGSMIDYVNYSDITKEITVSFKYGNNKEQNEKISTKELFVVYYDYNDEKEQ